MIQALVEPFRENLSRASARSVALLLDFDGTLAPIVPTPDQAEALPTARDALVRLAALPSNQLVTAVISGRMLSDLRSKISWEGSVLAGNHGLEIEWQGGSYTHEEAHRALPELDLFVRQLNARLDAFPGAWIEEKGLSIAVHYRQLEEALVLQLRSLVEDFARPMAALEMRAGKKVWELLPAVDWDKGTTVHFILERARVPGDTLVAYLGDDLTDEDAFREVNRLNGISVKVGETDMPTDARRRLPGPLEVALFLQALAVLYNV